MTRIVKKPKERRNEIIQAARELFETNGYQNTAIQAVMEKLNIAKGTIYHYFASKEALLEAVVEDLIDEDLRKKKKLINSRPFKNLDALGKFKALATAGTIAEENEQILDGLHSSGNTVMHTQQLGRYITMLAPYYAAVIQEGCDQGIFRTACPLECAEMLLTGVQFLTDVGCYPWSQDQLARRVKAIPSLVEAQLGAPEGSMGFLAE